MQLPLRARTSHATHQHGVNEEVLIPTKSSRSVRTCWTLHARSDGIEGSRVHEGRDLSTVRTSVIENFLTSVHDDESIPDPVATALRDLLTRSGRAADTQRVVDLVRKHATKPDTSPGGAA